MLVSSGTGSEAVPLEVQVGEQRWTVTPGQSLTIGRDADATVPVEHWRVSRRHATVENVAAGWVVTDHSRYGLFLEGRRTPRLSVVDPTVVALGHPVDGVKVRFTPLSPQNRPQAGSAGPARRRTDDQQTGTGARATHASLSGFHPLAEAEMSLGRLPENDVVVDDLLVSRRHAVLRRGPGGWRLHDLGSANGTFVNGQRVDEAVVVEGDLIGLGHVLLQLSGDELVEYRDQGDVDIRADDLVVVTRKGDRLLDGVSFSLPPRSLLAVLGPSGSGKSTLLGALTGARPAESGTVLYGGRDLYTDYEELRQRIGLVPQDDILHPQLTVHRALTHGARLRFPPDVPATDRARRIQEVIDELGLSERAHQRIESLSGGQRKRTSVALELLTRPSLLFLDEPTSGLDPGLDKQVMHTLRELADAGRTVVVVTHSVANLDLCDQLLILAPGGRVAYDGPPQGALEYFGVADFADVFIQLEKQRGVDWTGRLRNSGLGRRSPGRPRPRPELSADAESPSTGSGVAQFRVLCRRTVDVVLADRTYLMFLGLLPVLLSALAHAIPSPNGLSVASGDRAVVQLLLVLVMGGALMGTATSIRELVKERSIYQRERAIGLSRAAYLASKLTVLGVLGAGQATIFCILALLGRRGPDEATTTGSAQLEIAVAIVAVTCCCVVLGLLISTVISNADRGMPLLVLAVMLQLVLAGGLFPLFDRAGLNQLSWILPSRWGFAMGASTIDLGSLPPPVVDPLWRHSADSWTGDLLVLGVLTLVMVALVLLGLRRCDPPRRRATRRRWAPARPGLRPGGAGP